MKSNIDLGDMMLMEMKYRDKYIKYSPILKSPLLNKGTTIFPYARIIDFGRWFNDNPDAEKIDRNSFALWTKLTHREGDGGASNDDWVLNEDLDIAEKDLPIELQESLSDKITIEVKNLELQTLLKQYNEGNVQDLFQELRHITDTFEGELRKRDVIEYTRVSIEELLEEERNQDGLKWRLKCLNESTRPLRPGDFIILAARPDAGKTSFLCSEITFIAKQIQEHQSVLWINNEGPRKRIIGRSWQAALNASMQELEELNIQNKLYSMYDEEVGGEDKIKIYDAHELNSIEIENLIKRDKPGVVVFDMIDNIKFMGANHLGGQRTDQLLETMYQWARLIGVKYNCVVIATSQVSADGEGMRFPNQSMLKDSKTGKQGAADVIIILGKDNEVDNLRFISIPKNKLAKSGRKDPRCEVIFDSERSRFIDKDVMKVAPNVKSYKQQVNTSISLEKEDEFEFEDTTPF